MSAASKDRFDASKESSNLSKGRLALSKERLDLSKCNSNANQLLLDKDGDGRGTMPRVCLLLLRRRAPSKASRDENGIVSGGSAARRSGRQGRATAVRGASGPSEGT